MNYFIKISILLLFVLLSGCSLSPPAMTSIGNNKLLEIQAAYISTIKQANLDTQKRWQHGRLGNITVNLEGKPNVGLCYHWQEIVYVGIQKAIKSTGWRATGVAINEGTFMEHHAVLVYDPNQLAFNQIFNKKNNMKSYVLDPWKSGKPKLYTLKNWLLLPFSTEKRARLTKIEHFKLTGYKP